VTVPRGWLLALVALFVAPWLIAGALYSWSANESGEDPATAGADRPGTPAAIGPWGRLTVTPIVVSPPLEYVSTDRASAGTLAWYFPNTSLDVIGAFLAASGLAAGDAERIRATARPEPRIEGYVAFPDRELLRRIDPQVRARIYTELARSSLNFDQIHAYRFLGASPAQWFDGSPVSAETRKLVEPLIYADGSFIHFADLELVRPLIADPAELRRLVKALHRQSTVIVRLSIADAREIGPLAEYWGRGGRRTDLQPLLESLAGAGPDRSIDIVHLLPSFARDHLYRYPRISAADLDRPIIANCLWSSLNFFENDPDDRFLDVNAALTALKRDYYVIQDGFQLGDIVAFLDEEGDLFHVAVYLADNLVFTKNGTSPMAPWTIMSIEAVKGYYRSRAREMRLIYHRRNDL
jgi:hypothetical protein